MNPTIMTEVAKHRIADLHRQADRDRIARAARRVRSKHASHLRLGYLAASFRPPRARRPGRPRPAPASTTRASAQGHTMTGRPAACGTGASNHPHAAPAQTCRRLRPQHKEQHDRLTWLDQRRAAVVASNAQEAATSDDRDHASAAIPPRYPAQPSAACIRGQPPFPIPEVVMNPIHTIRRLASILAGLAATTLAFAAAAPAALATRHHPTGARPVSSHRLASKPSSPAACQAGRSP
jgi:hypothetical protein